MGRAFPGIPKSLGILLSWEESQGSNAEGAFRNHVSNHLTSLAPVSGHPERISLHHSPGAGLLVRAGPGLVGVHRGGCGLGDPWMLSVGVCLCKMRHELAGLTLAVYSSVVTEC